jgi:hypothetical protein
VLVRVRSTANEIKWDRMPQWFSEVFPLPGAPYAAACLPSREHPTRYSTKSLRTCATDEAKPW